MDNNEIIQALRNLSVEFDICVVKTNHADISRLLWRAADRINYLQDKITSYQKHCEPCDWRSIKDLTEKTIISMQKKSLN